jgi:imidazole glycerol phosphate synthase subunit HisF
MDEFGASEILLSSMDGDAVTKGGADGVLAESIFHFGQHAAGEVKVLKVARGIAVRQ